MDTRNALQLTVVTFSSVISREVKRCVKGQEQNSVYHSPENQTKYVTGILQHSHDFIPNDRMEKDIETVMIGEEDSMMKSILAGGDGLGIEKWDANGKTRWRHTNREASGCSVLY
ncbi:hypothetical protein MAR_021965 [Mya arenaria]|uniref:Uncharacterized protein n=1 Tax=Mya arenaria TaxID=6604 RepID=A0ABY7EHF5_MYAAR|nr:hypothetical protein MAR_021965 [Mya arenaria]